MSETGRFSPAEQLKKYGWTKGSGLGLEEHGIKEAIKVKIKKDNTGVGHDAGQEFSFHWWDHVFNKAASSIQVQNSESGVTVKKTKELNLSTKKSEAKWHGNKKNLLYGTFIKAATLTNQGIEVKEKQQTNESAEVSDTEDPDIGSLSKLTDEELFKACGGRTVHKAARHGHGLNGKLERIARQEAAMYGQDISAGSVSSPGEERKALDIVSAESKKKKAEREEKVCPIIEVDNDSPKKSKKRKKKSKRHKKSGEDCCSNGIELDSDDNDKQSNPDADVDIPLYTSMDISVEGELQKSKYDRELVRNVDECVVDKVRPRKRTKKSKNEKHFSMGEQSNYADNQQDGVKHKKEKMSQTDKKKKPRKDLVTNFASENLLPSKPKIKSKDKKKKSKQR